MASPRFVLRDRDYAGVSALGLSEARPAFGDLDGDGDGDLLLGDQDGQLHFYRNTGSIAAPSWTLAAESWQGIDVGSNAVPQLLDLNSDGVLDLVIGEKNGNLNRFDGQPGSGDLVFVAIDANWGLVDVREGGSFGIGQAAPCLFPSPQAGRWELLVGANAGRIHYYNRIDPDSGPFVRFDSTFAGYGEGSRAMPAVGDFDGDGLLDLVVGNTGGGLVWYQGRSSSGVEHPSRRSLSCRPNPLPLGQPLQLKASATGPTPFAVYDAQGRLRLSGQALPSTLRIPGPWTAGLYHLHTPEASCRFVLGR
jgi:hypothetical protein